MSVAYVARITAVEPHPDPLVTHMSVLRIGDLQGVSQNIEGDTPGLLDKSRYNAGDLVVIMVKNAILPDDVLQMGFWDPTKNDGAGGGILEKNDGTRKGARQADKKFHKFNSQFITFPVHADHDTTGFYVRRGAERMIVDEGTDVAEFFGVKEFTP